MDEELQALETELSRLRPVKPSPALHDAIALELDRSDGSRAWRWPRIAWPIAAALALLAAFSATWRRTSDSADPTGSPQPVFKPVAAENVLLSSSEDGVVTLADGTRVRRIRESYLDTIVWRNAETNASLQWTLPREEVRFEPIAYQ